MVVLRLILRRLALGLITLWAASVLIFAGTEILPGDVATAILGQAKTPEAVAAIRDSLGLSRPAYIRYTDWLVHFVKGDIGKSLANQRDIAPEIRERLGNTLFLAGVAAFVSVPLSIFLGLIAAIRQNSVFDRVINALTLTTISFPEFFVGYLLIILFAVKLDWFPSLAMISGRMTLLERLEAVALPAMTLVLVVLAHMMRQTRATVISVLASPFIEMAFLKGIPRWRIVFEHGGGLHSDGTGAGAGRDGDQRLAQRGQRLWRLSADAQAVGIGAHCPPGDESADTFRSPHRRECELRLYGSKQSVFEIRQLPCRAR